MVYGREREDLNNDLDNADRDVREREEESSNGALIALLCHHSQLDRVTVSLFVLHFDRDIRQIPTTNLIMRRAGLSTLNCALVVHSSFSLLFCSTCSELYNGASDPTSNSRSRNKWLETCCLLLPLHTSINHNFHFLGKVQNLETWKRFTNWHWQAGKITIEQDDKVSRWQDDKMIWWQDDQMTRWPDDDMGLPAYMVHIYCHQFPVGCGFIHFLFHWFRECDTTDTPCTQL